MKLIPQKLEG